MNGPQPLPRSRNPATVRRRLRIPPSKAEQELIDYLKHAYPKR